MTEIMAVYNPHATTRDEYVIDTYSSTWKSIYNHLTHELKDQRELLESTSLSEIKTAELRGSIKTLRALLALPEEQAQQKRAQGNV